MAEWVCCQWSSDLKVRDGCWYLEVYVGGEGKAGTDCKKFVICNDDVWPSSSSTLSVETSHAGGPQNGEV
jgi:hypothetical protein